MSINLLTLRSYYEERGRKVSWNVRGVPSLLRLGYLLQSLTVMTLPSKTNLIGGAFVVEIIYQH